MKLFTLVGTSHSAKGVKVQLPQTRVNLRMIVLLLIAPALRNAVAM